MPKTKAKKIPYARLKGLRAENGLTLDDMAKILNVTRTTYWYKESGKNDFTSTEIGIVRKLFKLSADEIFFS